MSVLPEHERRRGLVILLAGTFLMFGGFFMLVPLISVHYVRDLRFAAAAVGFALAIRQLIQQGLTLFGGALADRWGAKWLMCGGMLLRAAGFGGLAWSHTLPSLIGMCVLAALGGSLFEAPRSAAIAALTHPRERARFFSISGIVGGLGMTLGPLIGVVLVEASWPLVCFVSALCFATGGVLTALLLPDVQVVAERQTLGRGIVIAAHDGPFVILTALLGGYWFMWVQLAISLPLAAQRFEPLVVSTALGAITIGGVASVYTINAGLTVVLQYPVLALAQRYLRPLTILMAGAGMMGVGLAAVVLARSMAGLLGCVAIFSIGALLVQPVQQSVTAELADPTALGSYFGFSALALAFGGGLGNFAGGWLYDVAQALGTPRLPWLTFGTVGAIVAVGLLLLDRARFQGRFAGTTPRLRDA
ncbi:MAG TPA: MFS transporter [Herpetosiphonaceae bacterium]|nr:MFS transporter [Herpetosiphonaceae bacterium]